mmetsp:Transcript_34541/g.60638  ORF Transcript_34541/g.60638 Transcript_34541/m.60638 type:complete len:195 (-) Transcript_34541:2046-2630(-)
MVSRPGQLDLCNRDLSVLPLEALRDHHRSAEHINASHNQLSNAAFLKGFTQLKTVNLDYNHFTNFSSFPVIEALDTLSLNCNRLEGIDRIIAELAVRFPSLKHLSMLNNPCCPTLNPHATEIDINYYRYALIYALPWLTTLDGSEISKSDRATALSFMRRSDEMPRKGLEDRKKPTKKRAVDSEGNRFITNADL